MANLTAEVDYLKNQLADMTLSSREASTAATIARLRLSEREDENQELIDELIASKMNCANYAADYEEENRILLEIHQ